MSANNFPRDSWAGTPPSALALRALRQLPYLTPSENVIGQPAVMLQMTQRGLYEMLNRQVSK
jgi:hypothetical protein